MKIRMQKNDYASSKASEEEIPNTKEAIRKYLCKRAIGFHFIDLADIEVFYYIKVFDVPWKQVYTISLKGSGLIIAFCSEDIVEENAMNAKETNIVTYDPAISSMRHHQWLELGTNLFDASDKNDLFNIHGMEKLDKLLHTHNSTQPYHNKDHIKAVALRAVDILYNTLTDSRARDRLAKQLFMAASIHDLGHSAGRLTDHANISNAIDLFRDAYSLTGPNANVKIERAVWVTQFPFVTDPESIIEMCLRDADLLMILESDFDTFIFGLGKEMDKELSYEDNIEFLKKQIFFTAYGKKLFEDYLKNDPRHTERELYTKLCSVLEQGKEYTIATSTQATKMRYLGPAGIMKFSFECLDSHSTSAFGKFFVLNPSDIEKIEEAEPKALYRKS